MNLLKTSLALFVITSLSAQAATVALGTSANDPDNFGTFSNQTLISVTLNGINYTTDQLTQITLTAWVGGSASQILTTDGGAVNPDPTTRRGFLETDWSGNTGLINPSRTAGSVGITFNSPVKNIAGADLFLYEINSGNPDAFDITINGNTSTISGSSYGASGTSTADSDVLSLSSGTPGTLNALLTGTTSRTSTDIDQAIQGVGIDFSDFGVALGATVSSFTLDSSTDGNTFDPVIIAAVPEVSSIWLLSLAALAFALMKRK